MAVFMLEMNPAGYWCSKMWRDKPFDGGRPSITTGDFAGLRREGQPIKEIAIRHTLRLRQLPDELDIPLRRMALEHDAAILCEIMERQGSEAGGGAG